MCNDGSHRIVAAHRSRIGHFPRQTPQSHLCVIIAGGSMTIIAAHAQETIWWKRSSNQHNALEAEFPFTSIGTRTRLYDYHREATFARQS